MKGVKIDNGLWDEGAEPYIAHTQAECRTEDDLHLFDLVKAHGEMITLGQAIGTPVWR